MPQFSWLPFFEEMLAVICAKYDKDSLCKIFHQIFADTGGRTDRFADGTKGDLREIDPLTFIVYFNRNNTESKRIAYCSKAKAIFGLKSDVPDDFSGIPYITAQNTWFFHWAKDRRPDDHMNIWSLSRQLNEATVKSQAFSQILHIKNVGVAKLTQLMFICKPHKYLSLDIINRRFLESRGIDAKTVLKKVKLADGFQAYTNLLDEVRSKFPGKEFFEISYQAWIAQSQAPPEGDGNRYWVIAPGGNAEFWEDWQNDGLVAIGWDSLGDLRNYDSKRAMENKLQELSADEKPRMNSATECFQFCRTMKEGDYVFAKKGASVLLGFGQVTSDYIYDPSRPKFHHVRKVEWRHSGNWAIPEDIKKIPLKTLTDITSRKPLLDWILPLVRGQKEPTENGEKNYWWLNANPRIWSFTDIKVGEKQYYRSTNDQGNKRRVYKHFSEVQEGDIVLGYIASPRMEIGVIGKITKGLHPREGVEAIEFTKTRDLRTPVPLKMLQSISELQSCEPIRSNQGSLFKVTSDEYEIIADVIDELNPDTPSPVTPYSKDDALKDLFITESEFDGMIDALRYKNNIVLQGPPGVGKTFIAKRIAYALMGELDNDRIEMIQFHQSYSYEDFIQGYRPNDDGQFDLKNGVFYEFCRRAQLDSDKPYVFIIDEINRGNLSKIFGELMLLIEADKRGKEFALPLTYAKIAEDRFYIPQNVYFIGTMNTADRSLAMVDYALRRRFSFITLEPQFRSSKFKDHLKAAGIDQKLCDKIVDRMGTLNEQIAKDTKNLGRGYCVGHSFFCPDHHKDPHDESWYTRIIAHEIEPLLNEYWFDDPDKASEAAKSLLE